MSGVTVHSTICWSHLYELLLIMLYSTSQFKFITRNTWVFLHNSFLQSLMHNEQCNDSSIYQAYLATKFLEPLDVPFHSAMVQPFSFECCQSFSSEVTRFGSVFTSQTTLDLGLHRKHIKRFSNGRGGICSRWVRKPKLVRFSMPAFELTWFRQRSPATAATDILPNLRPASSRRKNVPYTREDDLGEAPQEEEKGMAKKSPLRLLKSPR